MRIPTTRRALAPSPRGRPLRRGLLSTCFAAAVFAGLLPAPAHASDLVCRTLVESVPGVSVDLDGDGYPDYRIPSIHDVTLCADAGAGYVTYPPRTENCFAGWHPTCMAIYVTVVPVDAQAGARADLCFRVENSRYPTCGTLETVPLPAPVRQTACIGYDLGGGHPCSGSTLALTFE